jgi:hypothetical protein
MATPFIRYLLPTLTVAVLLSYLNARRNSSAPATSKGHVLVRSPAEKALAGFNLLIAGVVTLAGAVVAVQGDIGAGVFIVAAGGAWVRFASRYWLATRLRVELSDEGLWLLGCRTPIRMAWKDVASVSLTSVSGGLIVRDSNGDAITIDKAYVGAGTSGIDYLRRYIPISLFPAELKYDTFWCRLVEVAPSITSPASP